MIPGHIHQIPEKTPATAFFLPHRNHGKRQGKLESLVTALLLGYMVSSKATETGPFWGGWGMAPSSGGVALPSVIKGYREATLHPKLGELEAITCD